MNGVQKLLLILLLVYISCLIFVASLTQSISIDGYGYLFQLCGAPAVLAALWMHFTKQSWSWLRILITYGVFFIASVTVCLIHMTTEENVSFKTLQTSNGLAKVEVPNSVQEIPQPDLKVVLYAEDTSNGIYAMISTPRKNEVAMKNYQEYAKFVSEKMKNSMENFQVQTSTALKGKYFRQQFQVSGRYKGVEVRYLGAVVDGKDYYDTLTMWTSAEKWERKTKAF